MYTITVNTFNGLEKQFSMIDKEYALYHFNQFMQAIDCKSIVMTDGLTGELFYEWTAKDGFTFIEGIPV